MKITYQNFPILVFNYWRKGNHPLGAESYDFLKSVMSDLELRLESETLREVSTLFHRANAIYFPSEDKLLLMNTHNDIDQDALRGKYLTKLGHVDSKLQWDEIIELCSHASVEQILVSSLNYYIQNKAYNVSFRIISEVFSILIECGRTTDALELADQYYSFIDIGYSLTGADLDNRHIIEMCLKIGETRRAVSYVKTLLKLGLLEPLYPLGKTIYQTANADLILREFELYPELYNHIVSDIVWEYFNDKRFKEGIEFLVGVGRFEERFSENYYLLSSLDREVFEDNLEDVESMFCFLY